ncbi:MAG: aspartate kinase [Tissierellia bacterium]|nr:aspartate kinase [Tissierellia bacterium]
MTIVAKFGGSSLANASQFEKVKNIVLSNPERKYIVPSAPGRVHKDEQKVTDLLILLYDLAVRNLNTREILLMIKDRYQAIIQDLELSIDLSQEFETIEKNLLSDLTLDYVLSRGEYLNGKLLAHYLGYEFMDPMELIYFLPDGRVDGKRTYAALDAMAKEHQKVVIPGFYGCGADGKVKTFSRGGSDITGSIIACGVSANLYENWTDVTGFLAADPRIVDKPHQINFITYPELRELSYSGASILHEEAVFPVTNKGIPIEIRNTNAPEEEGTYIIQDILDDPKEPPITGVAGRKNFSVINLQKIRMSQDLSFLRKALTVFEANDVFPEHIPSSIDSLSFIISDSYLENKRERIISELKTFCAPDEISISSGIALVTIVGRNMKNRVGISSKIFTTLADNNINIQMIVQGASEINIIIGVREEDFAPAQKVIYEAFFQKEPK